MRRIVHPGSAGRARSTDLQGSVSLGVSETEDVFVDLDD
jgi:hypothetical protein